MSDQKFAQFRFQHGRQAEADTARQLAADCKINVRIAVSQNVRQKCANEVHVFIAVNVIDLSSVSMRYEERGSAGRELDTAF